VEQGVGVHWWMKSWIGTGNVLLQPSKPLYAGLHQKQRDQQIEGGDSAPLLYSGETTPQVLRLVLRFPL